MIGAAGSRLLRGTCEEHETVEAEAVSLLRAETVLFFSHGYFPICLLTTAPQRSDLRVSIPLCTRASRLSRF